MRKLFIEYELHMNTAQQAYRAQYTDQHFCTLVLVSFAHKTTLDFTIGCIFDHFQFVFMRCVHHINPSLFRFISWIKTNPKRHAPMLLGIHHELINGEDQQQLTRVHMFFFSLFVFLFFI